MLNLEVLSHAVERYTSLHMLLDWPMTAYKWFVEHDGDLRDTFYSLVSIHLHNILTEGENQIFFQEKEQRYD